MSDLAPPQSLTVPRTSAADRSVANRAAVSQSESLHTRCATTPPLRAVIPYTDSYRHGSRSGVASPASYDFSSCRAAARNTCMERLYFRSFFLNFSGQSDTASARLPPSPQPRRRGRRGRRASGRYPIQPAVQPQAAGHGLDNLARPPAPGSSSGRGTPDAGSGTQRGQPASQTPFAQRLA